MAMVTVDDEDDLLEADVDDDVVEKDDEDASESDEAEAGDESADDDDQDEGEEDDGDKPAPRQSRRSKKTEARFDRLTKALGEKERELEVLRQQIAQQTQKYGAEVRHRDAEKTISDLEAERKELLTKKRAAIESGDTDEQIDVEEKLSEVRLKLQSIQTIIARDKIHQEDEGQNAQAARQTADTADAWIPLPPGDKPFTPAEETAWRTTVDGWSKNVGFENWSAAEQKIAFEMEKLAAQMVRRGTPAYFRQIGSMISAALPGRSEAVTRATAPLIGAKVEPKRQARVVRGSVAPATNDGARTDRLPPLTANDVQAMEAFHLDPKNKEHRRRWAQSVAATQRGE